MGSTSVKDAEGAGFAGSSPQLAIFTQWDPGTLSGWHIERATWPSHVIAIIGEYRRVFGLNDKQGYLAASGRNVRRAERKPHTNNVCIRRLNKTCLSSITRFIIRPMAISRRMCVSRLVRGPRLGLLSRRGSHRLTTMPFEA